ncbi:MAG: toxin-antitoxin system HicB family antitoxin [Sphingomonadales bacterium]|nr:toxin-antitoxin system HicB family antitoxin [Sphingomonadales bacterium]
MPPPNRKAFPLRLDPTLYEALERAAARDLRSVNAQVEVLLREALARRGMKVAEPEPVRRGRPAKGESR